MRLFMQDVRIVCRGCGRVIVTHISPGMHVSLKVGFAALSTVVAVLAFFLLFSKNWLLMSLLFAGFIALHAGTFLRLHAKNVHMEAGGREPGNSKASSQ
jgi:hypothetical protein